MRPLTWIAVAGCGSSGGGASIDTGGLADAGADAGAGVDAAPTPVLEPGEDGPYLAAQRNETFTRESTTTGEPRDLDTVIWYPAEADGLTLAADGRPFPLLMFSHGCGGIPGQSTFYTLHLPTRGFVVAAPPHPGSQLWDCSGCGCDKATLADSAANRPDDIRFVRDALLDESATAGSFWEGALDPNRVGVTGHSFGAWTALMLAAGGDGFVASLPMAPAMVAFDLSVVAMPVLMMGGGLDEIAPPEALMGYYDALPPPRFLLEMPRANHFTFTDLCIDCTPETITLDEAHPRINRLADAFFGAYVLGDPRYLESLAPGGDDEMTLTADP